MGKSVFFFFCAGGGGGGSRLKPGRIGGGKPSERKRGGTGVLHLAYFETSELTKNQNLPGLRLKNEAYFR